MRPINITYNNLSAEERIIAVQRLTALWAFIECGLGGALHALQIPFTGLVVGGLAVIIIIFIAKVSGKKYSQILKSVIIVLIVKAMVSPHTPLPAYVAVCFQAFMGFTIFSLFSINFISILLLAVIAMIESAVQKLIILTLFFGESIWKSIDIFIEFIGQQIGLSHANGSQWVITIYLTIYVTGGICIALLAFKTLKKISVENKIMALSDDTIFDKEHFFRNVKKTKNCRNKLLLFTIVSITISVILLIFSPQIKEGWLKVLKSICWTLTAIIAWYMILNPLFTKFIQVTLRKKQSRYSEEVLKILSLLPVLRHLTIRAWKKSSLHKGRERWQYFIITLLHWALTYTDYNVSDPPLKNQL
ncbi:MAG: hypothetical protein IPJ81_17050 [Chitinophagaceae bacterium]|nr:hypothetical protein [Chitinophagaceae bacterium]